MYPTKFSSQGAVKIKCPQFTQGCLMDVESAFTQGQRQREALAVFFGEYVVV